MNKRIKMAAGAGLAALALAFAGGGYYYFHVRTDTPDFAIKAVTESIENHNVEEFHRIVNVDSMLDSGYEGIVDGLIAVDNTSTPEARDAIKNFTEMLRAPMMATLKAAVDSYIATGDINAKENVGALEIFERTGLSNFEVHGVKNIELNDADNNEAFADVIIFHPELVKEFPLQIVLSRNADKKWQIVRVKNFQDYVAQINQARRMQIDEYLTEAGEINSQHEAIIRDAEQRYGKILSSGNLGNDKTRAELKSLIDDTFKKDWEARKQELFGLHVPKDAETLHNLYLRICDTWIDAAQDYSKWLDDKSAATIKSAEEKIHQAQTLTTDAANLAKRMTSQP